MKQGKAAFIYSEKLENYHYPPDCPFKSERAGMTRSILKSNGLYNNNSSFEEPPRFARSEELYLYHTQSYIESLKRISQGNLLAEDLFLGVATQDCPVFPDLFAYATLATGGTIRASELILEGQVTIAFNPSGGYHHAFAEKAGGFCYINDVVIACKILSSAGKKVFCLDLDAHHGNGTQAAFYTNPNVFTVSFHENGKTLFPWGGFEDESGKDEGYGFNVNMPLPAGTDDNAFIHAYNEIVPPLICTYKPDIIVLELGMDILSVDPLTHLSMTNNAIADLLPQLRDSGIPLLVVGGGGYHVESTARGWALAWTILCDMEPDNDLTIGMGGIFLSNSEWSSGMRDMRVYSRGEEKKIIDEKIEDSIKKIKTGVFPVHGITC